MSENPVRSESESRTGGGWGAPPTAGPAELHRSGLLFNGQLARSTGAPAASPASGPRLAALGRTRQDGTAARAAATATAIAAPLPEPEAVTRLRQVREHERSGGSAVTRTQTVTHFDLRSVAKVSAMFYAVVLIVIVVASILVWVIADAAGAVNSIDHSVQSLFGVKHYQLHPTTIAMYSCAAGAVVAVTGTLVNLLAAAVYNLIAEVVGGLRVKVSDS